MEFEKKKKGIKTPSNTWIRMFIENEKKKKKSKKQAHKYRE